MARFLITGGSGFIGSHLAEALLARGDTVTIIDNLSTGRFENVQHLVSNPRFNFAIDSITNEIVLDRLASQCDIMIHLAATVGVDLVVRSPVQTILTNVDGTEVVLRTARRYRARTLIASSSEVYGKGARVPFHEDDDVLLGPTCRARWAYAASKMIDEFLGMAYHHEYGLPVVPFRLFNTVGPRQVGTLWHGHAALCQCRARRQDPPGIWRWLTDPLLLPRPGRRPGHHRPGRRANCDRASVQHRLDRANLNPRSGATGHCPDGQLLRHRFCAL